MRAPEKTFVRARKLRKDMSLPEVLLWEEIRAGRLDGLRFRRQHPTGPYILDFYCAEVKLAVEVDGAQHDHVGQIHHDIRRDAWLGEQGIRVLRVAATEVLNDRSFEGVLRAIIEAAKSDCED